LVKFIFFSFIFHLTLLIVFKLEIVDLKKNKEQAVNVNLSVENKNINEKEKPKKEIKPKKTIKEKEKPKKEIKPKKTINEKEKPRNSNEEKFDDLLKNLAKEKLPLDSQNNFEEKLKELSEQKLKDNNRLNKKKPNKNELNAIEKIILNQIDENWSRPPGIKTSKNLIIKVIVGLDINGNVINLQIHNSTLNEIARDGQLQPYLDSAIRAIKKASPFEGLKKDRYNNWKELIINFKPIEAR
jgi:hypothetical protein